MKYFLISAMVLASSSVSAGTCNNGTLNGAYSMNFSTVSGSTIAYSGRGTFSGGKILSMSATGTQAGIPLPVTGSGTYSVNSNCIASATLTTSDGLVVKLKFYLDTMDMVPATNIAYHGVGVAWVAAHGLSYTSEINRLIGKF